MKISSALIFFVGVIAVMSTPVQKDKRLIKTSEDDPGAWLTEDDVIELKGKRIGFVDITNDRNFTLENVALKYSNVIPTNPRFRSIVNELINLSNRTRVENFVRDFSNFYSRAFNTEWGEQSQKWLLSQITTTLLGYNGESSVKEVEHTWRQKSIIARIEGSDSELKSEIVILGAHEDTLNSNVWNARAPGADDDGSGAAVVLETLRILVAAGIKTKTSAEFHFYAAEEVGMRGSADVAKAYSDKEVNVIAMLSIDVVGYQGAGINDVSVYTDDGNNALLQFLRVLVDEYLIYGSRDQTCGYACSDHASWTRHGYPAALTAECELNPYMHTENDTIENIEFTQVMEFVKLAVGFIIHKVAEPSQ